MEENAVVGPPSHKRRRSSESGNAVASLSLSSVSKKIKIKLKRIEFSEDDPFSDVKEENLPKNAYELLGVLSEESNSEDNGVSSTSEIKKEEDGSNKKDKFPDFNADDHNASIPVGYELYATSKYDRKWHPCRILESRNKSAAMLMAEEDLQRSEGETLSEEFERIGGKVAAELDQIHKEHPFMYYIHYLEYDRRMDRWIDRQELLLEKELEVMSIPQDSITKRSDIQIGGEHSSSDDHGGGGYGHGNDHGHDELTKMKNIETIVIGQYEMEAWYFSPFPAEVCRYNRLTFCEFCLSFFGHDEELVRHMRKCMIRHPPGHEIYRSKEQNVTIAVFEVDGAKEQIYCQNISLISKLFLDHKTLYYDTKIFLFYVLCEVYDDGYRFVAYFSKEKDPEGHQNNLACILTLPCHQRKGYGHFMISMSYELSKIENKPGSPEKPLSDLGRVSYYSYWAQSLLRVLVDRGHDNSISIEELSKTTAILPQDIFCVLEEINVLKHDGAVHTFEITDEHIARYLKVKKPNIGKDRVYVRPCLPEKLIWVPYMSPFQYKQKRASRFS